MSSISLLRKEKQRANNKNNLKDVANICNLLGAELVEVGEYEEALQEHREEANIFEALDDPIGVAIAHRRLGEVYSELQEWEKALEHQNKHLSLALKCGDPVEEQRAYATIGRTQMQRSEIAIIEENKELQYSTLAESEKAFLKALETCKKIGDNVDGKELAQMRCRVYHNLGLVVDLKGETTDAIKFVSQSLEICVQYDFTEDAYRSYAELARMHLKMEKFQKAVEEAQLSLKFGMKLQKKNYIADSHQLIAQIHLAKDDLFSAKRSCYKAYKTKHPDKNLRTAIERNLKLIVYVCNAREEMSRPETDDETRLKHLDKIGDAFATLGLYKQAIVFYEQRLSLALENGKSGSFLAPIYTSLAQTYKDMKQFEKAFEYFNKELKLHLNSNNKEAVMTLIEMAKISENLSQSYEKISSCFDQALQIAEKSALAKCQGVVIKNYLTVSCLPSPKRESLESQFEELQSRLGDDFDFELSDNEDESDSEEIDLDYIDFSDSDEEQTTSRQRPRRGSSGLKLKVNAIGESSLHQAVIKGNVSMVRKLLENNHPVNIRDNSGWLPIHEACNWGYCEIAEMLIDAGAWINDKGGRECSGTTPLHDAASNCHFDVVQLLVEKGASVLAKNDKGKTPLDCLVKFAAQNNLSDEDFTEFDSTKVLLIERMENAGHKVSNSLKVSKRSGRNLLGSKSSAQIRDRSSEATEEEEEPLPELDYNSDSELTYRTFASCSSQKNSATETYKTAMKSIGSHSRRADMPQSTTLKESAKLSLVPENDYVLDDWLIDDLETTKKRKRSLDKCEFEYKEKCSRSGNSDFKENNPSSSNIISTAKKKSRQPKLTSMLKKSGLNRSVDYLDNNISNLDEESEMEDEVNIHFSRVNKASNNKPLRAGFHSHDISVCAPLCLQVKVLHHKISVPVAFTAQSNTIGWLEEEASKRYFQSSGVKRNLKLFSVNGEMLNSDDIISQVLSTNNRELKATVTGSQDFDSMSMVYNKICRTLGTAVYSDVSSKLRECESLGGVDFSRLSLRSEEQFKPILTSIQFQNIQSLNFNSCRLGNAGMLDLIHSLPSLPLVETLQAEACSITTKSFLNLLNFLGQENSAVIRLCNFSLSYNDFSKVTFCNFLNFLNFPSLRELKVVACELSFMVGAENVLSNASSLYLDDNRIGLKSLSTIMSSCPRLTHFSIGGSILDVRNQNDPSLGSILSIILGSGDQCLLQHLDISSCNAMSEALDIISSYLYRCPVFTSLDLSENFHISSSSVINLLKELSACLLSNLKTLNLHGIKSLENDTAFGLYLANVIEKKATSCPFVSISVPRSVPNEPIKEVWAKVYKEKARVKCTSKIIYLKLKENL